MKQKSSQVITSVTFSFWLSKKLKRNWHLAVNIFWN
jgi:hypothetical protein